MNLSINQIIACLQLFSKEDVLTLCRNALENEISLNSVKDMSNYICLCIDKKMIYAKKKPKLPEIQRSLNLANCIIDDSEKKDIKIVSHFDKHFPPQLKKLYQNKSNVSPLVLYYKGDIQKAGKMDGIAIIGTRRPTREGIQMGEYFGKFYASKGFNIVSGLALGCDAAAHRGALSAKGLTTAIVAHGLQYIYPSENEFLAHQILAENGVILSEYPTGTICSAKNLVERCRLQAGLANSVLVIQTDIKKGGSMHAVRTAIENNKDVFAVEYNEVHLRNHPMIAGNIQLIANSWAKPLRKET